MNFKMYAVKDEMTGKFMNPIFMEDNEVADNLATRHFGSQLNNIQLWKDNPNDYSLYLVGQFDDEEGANAIMIQKVASGRSVLKG